MTITRPVDIGPRVYWQRLGIAALTAAGIAAWLGYILEFPLALDAHAYFAADLRHLYGGAEGRYDTYPYSPAFAQALEPLRWPGWDVFRTVWRGLELAALVWFTGPLVGLAIFVWPVALEVNLGNIHLLLAAAIVAGFRWPALWSFVLLTKITPGIGLLWFVVRREWRSLAIALGATAAMAGVSFVVAPGLWFDWITSLALQQGPVDVDLFLTAPLIVRVGIAAALVVWGAQRDKRWTVLVAAFIALPYVWMPAVVMLVGLVPLLGPAAYVRFLSPSIGRDSAVPLRPSF